MLDFLVISFLEGVNFVLANCSSKDKISFIVWLKLVYRVLRALSTMRQQDRLSLQYPYIWSPCNKILQL